MGSLVNPVICRVGYAFDWLIDSTVNKKSLNIDLRNEDFIIYIAQILTTNRSIHLGFIFSGVKLKILPEVVLVEVSMYTSMNLRCYLQGRLAYIEQRILHAGFSLFKKPIKVLYFITGNYNISASSIISFMYLRLRRGVFVSEIFRELRFFMKMYFKKKFFVGFKILCKGRFSRKQRAGRRVLERGPLPVQNYSCIMDLCQKSIVMKYGVSNLKVWLFKRYFKNPSGIVLVI